MDRCVDDLGNQALPATVINQGDVEKEVAFVGGTRKKWIEGRVLKN